MKSSCRICLCITTLALSGACAPDSDLESEGVEDARTLKAPLTQMGACEPGLDYAGRCEGDDLVWCEEGQQLLADCAASGQTCAWENDAIGNNCVSDPSSSGGACGDVDYEGYCDGDRLVWCEAGSLAEVECSDTGRSCGYQGAGVGYNCVGASPGGGGDLATITEIVGGAYFDISQDYGYSDFYGGYDYCQGYGDFGGNNTHCGLDVAIPYGTALYIPAAATVITAGGTPYFQDETNSAAGELKFRLGDGTEVIFGHMSYIALGTNQSVGGGQYAGDSGTANGGHVHIEVRVPSNAYGSGFATVDPLQFFGW